MFRLGIDVGSTTVKTVLLDRSGATVFSAYRRHNADVRGELMRTLREIDQSHPGLSASTTFTGSGGLSIAGVLGVPFVQEVIAETEASRQRQPGADIIIELGGEDAKITYLHPVPEQRMNGTCAGGTGAFIDQMAVLLRTDTAGLDDLASRHQNLYPIASRCGVFAKSDLQPLINQGAAREDLAASIFAAVATQCIAGLACGRPIRGSVMFLGGPLHFLPELRAAFQRQLQGATEFIVPDGGELYVALGAALLADREAGQVSLSALIDRLDSGTTLPSAPRLRPLFADAAEKSDFDARHGGDSFDVVPIEEARGRCWLGIDAGSTTIKAVLLDEQRRIVFTSYASNDGDPLAAGVDIVKTIRENLPESATIGRSCSTGYGEGILAAGLSLDQGEVETMAHFRAARELLPDVTSVIDIGGQDMKYLRIKNGVVDSISVNEACSSGCGSFLQTFAQTMNTDIQRFAAAALQSDSPIDLGTRCTVFMNSSVKQAQREGATVPDISAGLSYSVVRNALYKVIKIKDVTDLGDNIVVQGGTFLNDAVLRAFELLTGAQVRRPSLAGLMGAYGAALTAMSHDDGMGESALATLQDLEDFSVESEHKTCRLCQNHCQMTISTFATGERHVSGNRCERGASLERIPPKSTIPNLFDWKYKRIFGYRRLTADKAFRGDVGIPRVMNMYENYPFWFTLLTKLGFRVIISGRSSHDLFERGMESIPSENVCYPAKLAHGHVESLLDKGIQTIFYPAVMYEEKGAGADSNFNCPIVATYPELIRNNLESLETPGVRFLSPFVNLSNRDFLPGRLCEVFADWEIPLAEMKEAVTAAYEEDAAFKRGVRDKGAEALQWLADHQMKGIVLAGRPYHLDPEINHGIAELIVGLGMGVLTEDSVADGRLRRPLRVRDQWSYHSRLYEAAARVADEPELQMVQLNSFGCGIDAITADQVQEILESLGDVHTVVKIDEVSNLGAARIRLRSLQAAVAERSEHVDTTVSVGNYEHSPAEFTKQMKDEGYEILAPQMSPIHFRLVIPALRAEGYNLRLLENTSAESNEIGLKYVNNDACYPAIVVIGQLIEEFTSGRSDPDRAAVAITQTGGMCRATNYAGLLRKGLIDAGYPQVPVVAVSAQGLENHSGFRITPRLAHRLIQAGVLGDMLQAMLLRLRPYEGEPGAAERLYLRWDSICQEWLCADPTSAWLPGRRSDTWGGRLSYKKLINQCVREFAELELSGSPRKPRVGLVGEILVKYHPGANNHAVRVIESEGCEAELPALMQFFHKTLATSAWDAKSLGIGGVGRVLKPAVIRLLQQYEKPIHRAFLRTDGKFIPHRPIGELAQSSQEIAQMGNQAGEGWYLTAEMVDMIEHGCTNIICVQPFACLPNHVVGKGMFRTLRQRYPEASITSIDYDPGSSEANQLNRIKLMLSGAQQPQERRYLPVFPVGDSGATSCAGCPSGAHV